MFKPLAAFLILTIPSLTVAETDGPEPLESLLVKADKHEVAGDLSAAADALESAVKAHPKISPAQIRRAGELRFFDAEIDASIALFDKLIERQPDSAPYLWQRGLSLYYAGRFQDGVDQFETHQTVNPNDVENAAWHFICVTRAKSFEEAQKRLIPIEGDRRIPMAEIHDLFAGKATPEDVLKSASRDEFGEGALRSHLCYAHLYLGLYFEAKGDAEKAADHIKKAAVDFKTDHYMGRCAQVHHKLLTGKKVIE